MNYVRDIFNSIIGPSSTSNENNCEVGTNELRHKVKPNFLDQGKTLHREKIKRSEDLISSIRVMDERINNGFINNGFIHNNIEGFGNMTSSKNSADLSDTTTLSNDFDKNIERYNKEYPLFIDETRNYMKLNDRNKNIKDNSSLFTNRDNNFYDITYEKEGCYKSSGGSGLELQTDLNDVSVKTCKMHASDLGYSGFAIRKDPSGKLGCYLSKDISAAKTGGIATKPMTSLAFKTSSSANMGGLLFNGQLGIYNNTIDNNLVTDLTGIEGCDAKNKGVLINEESVVATWGGNCIDTSKQYRLKNVNSTNCLYNNSDGRFGTYTCIDFNDQYWTLFAVPGQKNTYMFKGVNSQYSLYADTNGEFRTAISDINNPTQQWELVPISGQTDTYLLKNKQTSSCIISNSDGRFNMDECTAPYNDQWWNLIPVEPVT